MSVKKQHTVQKNLDQLWDQIVASTAMRMFLWKKRKSLAKAKGVTAQHWGRSSEISIWVMGKPAALRLQKALGGKWVPQTHLNSLLYTVWRLERNEKFKVEIWAKRKGRPLAKFSDCKLVLRPGSFADSSRAQLVWNGKSLFSKSRNVPKPKTAADRNMLKMRLYYQLAEQYNSRLRFQKISQ